jgi:radical SAM-linked protein
VLPFDHLDCEVTKPYLWKERMASLKEGATHDCAYGDERCTACGACDYEVVDTIVYHPEDYKPQRRPPALPPPEGRTVLRLRYAKEGRAVALSHLETMTALLRAFRRAKMSIPHTQGFHPKPRVSFGPACPVGTESQAEYLDLELHGIAEAADVAERVRRELPEGFRLLSCERVDGTSESLSRIIRAIEYRVELPDGAPDAAERLAEFATRPEAAVLREREGKDPVRIDLKAAVQSLEVATSRELRFTLRAGENHATARPSELLSTLFGPEWVKPGVARIVRENVIFGTPAP